jgi:hypothetical protein
MRNELRLVSDGGRNGRNSGEQGAQSIDFDGITAAVAITRIE